MVKRLPPVVPEMKPGRLNGFGTVLNEKQEPVVVDLSFAAGIDDVIQVRANHDGQQWIALSENGEITGSESVKHWKGIDLINQDPTIRLRHLGYAHHFLAVTVGIDQHGKPHPLHPDHKMHRNFPKPDEPIVNVVTANDFGVMLTESAKAIMWGDVFVREEKRWAMPDAEFLSDVVEMCGNYEGIFFRKRNGDVVGWGAEGRITIPDKISRNVSAISMDYDSLVAVDFDGNLYKTPGLHRYGELVKRGEPFLTEVNRLKNRTQTLGVYRKNDGSWVTLTPIEETHALANIAGKLPDLKNYPPDAFVIGGTSQSDYQFMVWIEPAEPTSLKTKEDKNSE